MGQGMAAEAFRPTDREDRAGIQELPGRCFAARDQLAKRERLSPRGYIHPGALDEWMEGVLCHRIKEIRAHPTLIPQSRRR